MHLPSFSWIDAEEACTRSLNQQLSGKGFWRRSKARQELGKREEAILGRSCHWFVLVQPTYSNHGAHVDLQAMLKLRADDADATAELLKMTKLACSRSNSPLAFGMVDSTAPCGSSSTASGSPKASPSKPLHPNAKKLPFELHDVDYNTRIKVDILKRTWKAPDTGKTEEFLYPVWDSHDVRLS